MVEASDRDILDYLLTTQQGEMVKQGDRELKKIKIGDKTYNYDRTRPITDILKRKLNKVKETTEYKRHNLVNKKDEIWLKVDKKQSTHKPPKTLQSKNHRRTTSIQKLCEQFFHH